MLRLFSPVRRRAVSALMAGLLGVGAPMAALAAPELPQLASLTGATAGSATAPAASDDVDGGDDGGLNWLRILAGYGVTSGIKYALGGLGPARLLPLMSSLSPAMGVASLLGLGLLEAGISITTFQVIAGLKTTDRQALAFMLAAGSTALLSPLILGPLGPLGATLVSNAIRLVLFNLIARRDGEKLGFGLGTLAMGREEHGPTQDQGLAIFRLPELILHGPQDEGLGGDVASLHREVQARYETLLATQPALEAGAFEDYVVAKRSLDAALQASGAP